MNLLRRLKFNLSYLGKPPWDTGISPPELYDFIATHPRGRALDIGCGTGTNLITLANAGWQTTGFDFARRAIQSARRKIKHNGIQADIFQDDASEMNHVRGSFDLALDIGCFHSIPNKTGYLTQLSRILAPGGHWLMYGFVLTNAPQSAPGLVESDLESIPARGLILLSRKDGTDQQKRPSAWFLFQNKA